MTWLVTTAAVLGVAVALVVSPVALAAWLHLTGVADDVEPPEPGPGEL